MTDGDNDIHWVQGYLSGILPSKQKLIIIDQFQKDECRWFRAAIENGIIEVRRCPNNCSLKRGLQAIKDDFILPVGDGKPRHLFSLNRSGNYSFNREYLPHIAAYARLIIELGYNQEYSSFSKYRKFTQNLIFKKRNQGYETDAEFYDIGMSIYLHIEAKKSEAETEKLVAGLNKTKIFKDLSDSHAKELEYILEIKPKYIWLVGPNSVDPERYVYSVSVDNLDATFEPIIKLPAPPKNAL